MPEYRPYFGLPMMIRKMERITHEKYDINYETYLRFAYAAWSGNRMADFYTLVLEANHYLMSHHVLAPSKGLCEMLLRSRISVNLDHLRLPFATFEVTFDKTMKVPDTDIPIPSVLCSFYGEQSSIDFINKFCEDLTDRVKPPTPFRFVCSKKLVAFRMVDPRTPDDSINKVTLMFNLDQNYAQGKEIEQAIEEGPVLQTTDAPLDKEEIKIVRTASKLALGSICYLNMEKRQAEAYKDRNRPRMGNPPSITLLGKNCISDAYMRKGHIRTLSHERFKRDEFGYPRIVWVREHQVNPHGIPEAKDPKIEEMEEVS